MKEIRFLLESKILWNLCLLGPLLGQGLTGDDLVVNRFWAPVNPWSKLQVKIMHSREIYVYVMKNPFVSTC